MSHSVSLPLFFLCCLRRRCDEFLRPVSSRPELRANVERITSETWKITRPKLKEGNPPCPIECRGKPRRWGTSANTEPEGAITRDLHPTFFERGLVRANANPDGNRCLFTDPQRSRTRQHYQYNDLIAWNTSPSLGNKSAMR